MHKRILITLCLALLLIGPIAPVYAQLPGPQAPVEPSIQSVQTSAAWAWMVPPPLEMNVAWSSISCPTETFCVAVGTRGLILAWDGVTWIRETSPTHADLTEVTCPTAEVCKATGLEGTLLSWNAGGGWAPQDPPIDVTPKGIICLSADWCKLVSSQATFHTWNGSIWSTDPSEYVSTVPDIDCISENGCKAVGYVKNENGSMRAASQTTWDGTSWKADVPASTLKMTRVSCVSPVWCKAAGLDGTLASWDGSTWSADSSGVTSTLNAIVCLSTTWCKAVGDGNVALTWNGSNWSKDELTANSALTGLSCPSVNFCKAVGTKGRIVTWANDSWSGDTSGDYISMSNIDCFAPNGCKAIARHSLTPNVGDTILAWNGEAWTSEYSNPAVTGLVSIDCPSSSLCKAVGANGLILSWNGSTWSVEASGTTNPLASVVCPSTSLCKAVGSGSTVLSWNGSVWSADSANLGNLTTHLRSVSCASPAFCKAVGWLGKVITWSGSGSSWLPDMTGHTENLLSVDCPTTNFCIAGGWYSLISTWNGATWSAPVSLHAREANLLAIDCFSAARCKIAGSGTLGTWDSGVWSDDVRVSVPSSQPFPTFFGLNCPTPDYCITTGSEGIILAQITQTLTDVDASFTLTPFEAGCLTGISITQTNTAPPYAIPGMSDGRYWTITATPESCKALYNVDLTLPTSFPRVNGRVPKQSACRYHRSFWFCDVTSYSDISVTRKNVMAFSHWAAWSAPVDSISVLAAEPSSTAVFGAPLTLTATILSSSSESTRPPTGQVIFQSDGQNIPGCEAVPIVNLAQVICHANRLPVGAHTLTALYSGDLGYNSSSGALAYTITRLPFDQYIPSIRR